MPYQLQTLVRWLANQRCQCTWDFSGDNLRHVSYLKNCRTLPSDVLSDIQVNWIRGSGVCVLTLWMLWLLLSSLVIFAKVCGGQEVKALASSLASVLRRRRGCLLPSLTSCFHCVYLQICTLDPYPCWWFRLSKRCILICWFGLKVVRSSVALEDLQGRAF